MDANMKQPGIRPSWKLATIIILSACQSISLADTYHIGFSTNRPDDDGAMRKASVEATITPLDGKIGLWRSGSDTGLYHGWATFILNVDAVNESGDPLKLVYLPTGTWKVSDWQEGPIMLHYDMLLQHDRFPNEPGDDELAAARPYGVFWTTRALLMEGAPSEDVTVQFALPDEWRVTTPWHRRPGSWTFTPKDTDDLLDAAFVAGSHVESTLATGSGEARLAIGPPIAETEQLFGPLLQAYLGYYAELFGSSPSEAILLVALDASFLGGGVIGRTISLSIPPDADLNAAMPFAAYVIAHEGFHLWNVQWVGQDSNDPELEWLAEGSAEYYAILSGLRLGQIDETAFLSLLSERYCNYLHALQSGQTLVSAANTKLQSQASYDLLYSGGMLATLLIDLEVRSATGGALSADELIREIHRMSGQHDIKPLSLDGLGVLLADKYGYKFATIIERSLRSGDILPLVDAFGFVGISVSMLETDGVIDVSLTPMSDASELQLQTYSQWTSAQ
jgi:predicted metalloprotease with PDZ domain